MLVEDYLETHPKSRIQSILKYFRNGANVRQKVCVLCGELGPTWCGKWPKTRNAIDWEIEHIKSHLNDMNKI